MSWDDWVNSYIINHTEASGDTVIAICRRGAIVGLDGGIWGQVNFEFLTYEYEQEDDNGNIKKFVVNEWENFIQCWESKGAKLLPGGVRMNNEKFMVSNFNEDDEVMYLTGNQMGACVAKAGTCFCIGVYYKTAEPMQTLQGKTRNYSAGNANGAVQNCRDKCVEAGV